MILRTDKRTYLIMGAGFALVMALLSFCTSDLGIVYNLVSGLLVGALYGGIMLFMDKHQENKAYYCRHKVESAQEVICQGSAAIRKSSFGFNTSGWMFLGNTSLDYYKITAASGEKAMEINLSDIVSTTVSRNLLTIKTDVQAVTFGVGKANEWKKQIEQAAQQANLTQTAPKNNADNTQELIKFKQLLDSGVISQEEFDAKKKQLLVL